MSGINGKYVNRAEIAKLPVIKDEKILFDEAQAIARRLFSKGGECEQNLTNYALMTDKTTYVYSDDSYCFGNMNETIEAADGYKKFIYLLVHSSSILSYNRKANKLDLDFIDFCINRSMWADAWIIKDPEEVYQTGGIFDLRQWKSQYLISAAATVREIAEYNNMAFSFNALKKIFDDEWMAYIAAHMFCKTKDRNTFTVQFKAGHTAFDISYFSKSAIKHLFDKNMKKDVKKNTCYVTSIPFWDRDSYIGDKVTSKTALKNRLPRIRYNTFNVREQDYVLFQKEGYIEAANSWNERNIVTEKGVVNFMNYLKKWCGAET